MKKKKKNVGQLLIASRPKGFPKEKKTNHEISDQCQV